MAEVIRATALRAGLKSPGSSPIMPQIERSQSIEFSGLLHIAHKNTRLWIEPLPSTNGVLVTAQERPSAALAPGRSFPHSGPSSAYWRYVFAWDPTEPARQVFGDPPILEVEFLGHKDSETLRSLIENQPDHFEPDTLDATLELTPSGSYGIHNIRNETAPHWHRELIAAGPPFKTWFKGEGPTLSSDLLDRYYRDPVETTRFFGLGMFFVEARWREGEPEQSLDLNPSIATISQDGLLRVWQPRIQIALDRVGKDNLWWAVKKLAEVSIFFQVFVLNPEIWPRKTLRTRLLEDFKTYIKMFHPSDEKLKKWGRDFANKYGCDWFKILPKLPQLEVNAESAKLMDILTNLITRTERESHSRYLSLDTRERKKLKSLRSPDPQMD